MLKRNDFIKDLVEKDMQVLGIWLMTAIISFFSTESTPFLKLVSRFLHHLSIYDFMYQYNLCILIFMTIYKL